MFERKTLESELELEDLPKMEKKDGMIDVCKRCIGTGWIHMGASIGSGKSDKTMHYYVTCGICQGQGYIDWVQKVVKDKRKPI